MSTLSTLTITFPPNLIRDRSLIMGQKTGGRGALVKFYPYKKRGGGAEKVLAMLNGGTKSFRVVW